YVLVPSARSRPPQSSLLPYTTLFRSSDVRGQRGAVLGQRPDGRCARLVHRKRRRRSMPKYVIERDIPGAVSFPAPGKLTAHVGRSEEHTSELQSRGHLVCRLLLEKKK